MLELRNVLPLLRLTGAPAAESCFMCGRAFKPGDRRLVLRGLRTHVECAGYRARTAGRSERDRRAAAVDSPGD